MGEENVDKIQIDKLPPPLLPPNVPPHSGAAVGEDKIFFYYLNVYNKITQEVEMTRFKIAWHWLLSNPKRI